MAKIGLWLELEAGIAMDQLRPAGLASGVVDGGNLVIGWHLGWAKQLSP